jgi:enamine deaminase RidA (YjgF/YER057c/UK114 family)
MSAQPSIRVISTADALVSDGRYALAVVHGGPVYVSSQLPVVLGQSHDSDAPFETHRRAIDNLAAVLGLRVLPRTDSKTIRLCRRHRKLGCVQFGLCAGAWRCATCAFGCSGTGVAYDYLVEIDAIAAQGEVN